MLEAFCSRGLGMLYDSFSLTLCEAGWGWGGHHGIYCNSAVCLYVSCGQETWLPSGYIVGRARSLILVGQMCDLVSVRVFFACSAADGWRWTRLLRDEDDRTREQPARREPSRPARHARRTGDAVRADSALGCGDRKRLGAMRSCVESKTVSCFGTLPDSATTTQGCSSGWASWAGTHAYTTAARGLARRVSRAIVGGRSLSGDGPATAASMRLSMRHSMERPPLTGYLQVQCMPRRSCRRKYPRYWPGRSWSAD